MIVYHGATQRVDCPVSDFGRPNLDFGPGFYLTVFRNQAEEWARRQADLRGESPVLNIYSFDKDAAVKEFKFLRFPAYDKAWLHFIVDSRNGRKPWTGYDIIEGGMARGYVTDCVVDSINLFLQGLLDEDAALTRLADQYPNNQICFLSQEAIEKYLVFNEAIRL